MVYGGCFLVSALFWMGLYGYLQVTYTYEDNIVEGSAL